MWIGTLSKPSAVALIWKGQSCTRVAAEGKIEKSGCGNGWNGGAYSTRLAPGDITLQFKCTKAQHTMIGLAKGNSHSSYTDIDCAVYCDQGVFRVYERGSYRWGGPRYEESDMLSVEREGSTVKYFKGGQYLRTCGIRLQGNVIADLSIHNTGRGGILYSGWVGEAIIAEPVKWKAQACTTTAADGQILKNGCGNGWNGGAFSTNLAPGDVTLQFRCTRAQHTMIGLAYGNSHNSYTDIDCAMYCDQGTLRGYELGSHRWNGPTYSDLTVLALKRKGTVVTYYSAGKAFRTCGRRLSGNVNADLSIHNTGRGGVLSAVWVGRMIPPPGVTVVWKAIACAKTTGSGGIVKSGCGNGWNGGAISSKVAPGDITLNFRCTKSQHTMIGLAIGNSHNSYTDIDCAVYCDQGVFRVYELGSYKWGGPRYEQSDILGVERTGTTTRYLKNGLALRTCGRSLSGDVVADLSIHNTGRGGILAASWVGTVKAAPSTCKKQICSGGCRQHANGAGWATYCLNGYDTNTASKVLRATNVNSQSANAGAYLLVLKKGYYRVNAWADQHGSGGHMRLEIRRDNTAIGYSHVYDYADNGGWDQIIGDVTAPFNTNQKISIRFHADSNRGNVYKWHAWNANGQHSRLQVEYVGTPVIWSGGCRQHARGSGWRSYCLNGYDTNTMGSKLRLYNTNSQNAAYMRVGVTGFYRINAWADQYGQSNYRRVQIRRNDRTILYSHNYKYQDAGWSQITGDTTWSFNNNDKLDVRYQIDANRNSYIWHAWNANGQHSRLQVTYLPKLVVWSGGCRSHSRGAGWSNYCLNGQDYNTAGGYLQVSGNTMYVRRAGLWRVNFWADSHGAGGHYRIELQRNGSAILYTHNYNRNDGGWQQMSADVTMQFNTNDRINIRMHADSNRGNTYKWHAWGANGGGHSRAQFTYVDQAPC